MQIKRGPLMAVVSWGFLGLLSFYAYVIDKLKTHRERKCVREKDLSESSTGHNSVCAWWGPDGDSPWIVVFLTTVTKYLTKDLKEGMVFSFPFFELTVLGRYSPSWGRHDSKSRRQPITGQHSQEAESRKCWGSAHSPVSFQHQPWISVTQV